MNEFIIDEKDINNEIFLNYFKYQNSLFLVKNLTSKKQDKNETLVNNINDGLIDLRNAVNRKKFLRMTIRKKQSILLKKSSTLISNKKVYGLKY